MNAPTAETDQDTGHWNDLLDTLEHCALRVPLYKGAPAPSRELDPETACLRALERFPVLTKEGLRKAFPAKLVPEGTNLAQALKSQEVSFVGTSGTTGERVQVLWHQPWWNEQERAGWKLHPVSGHLSTQTSYREAVLTTPVCSGNLCHVGKLTMDQRLDGTILFLNQTADPGLWTDGEIDRIAEELEHYKPHSLECDPAYLAHFAVRLARRGKRPFQPGFINHSYEFPSRRHLAAIKRSFDVPVLDAYGSTECGFAFLECEHGRYHHNAAWTHADVLPLPGKRGLEGVGVLLLTTMRNRWLNLVRFDTGDLVRVASEPCPCGNASGLVLESFEGRVSDLLVREDGRFLTVRQVDQALANVDGLLNYRLRQRAPLDFELDLLGTGLETLEPAIATERLAGLLGAAPRTRVVASLPVEASGKYRLCQAAHLDAAKLAREGV